MIEILKTRYILDKIEPLLLRNFERIESINKKSNVIIIEFNSIPNK